MKPADVMRLKELLPTSLGSEEIREQIARDILARSVFSARMESAHYLSRVRDVCAQLSNGEIGAAKAREMLLEVLARIGHSPQDEGGITNPASIRRMNLVIETQRQMAGSVARLSSETEDTLGAFPAWELTRLAGRAAPRADWAERWQAAGDAVGWEGVARLPDGMTGGRMVALKTSPIWAALGDGAGGYEDTLGNPYPPFAYGSGMGWLDVDRKECIALGLIDGDEPSPDAPGGSRPVATGHDGAWPSLAPDDEELAEAARRVGWPGLFEGVRDDD